MAARTSRPGTRAEETTAEVGSACAPNHWSTAMLIDSSTQNDVSAAPAALPPAIVPSAR